MNLRDLLRARGMTQADLANRLTVSEATVSQWAAHLANPKAGRPVTPERLAEIAGITGIPAAQLRPDLAAAFAASSEPISA